MKREELEGIIPANVPDDIRSAIVNLSQKYDEAADTEKHYEELVTKYLGSCIAELKERVKKTGLVWCEWHADYVQPPAPYYIVHSFVYPEYRGYSLCRECQDELKARKFSVCPTRMNDQGVLEHENRCRWWTAKHDIHRHSTTIWEVGQSTGIVVNGYREFIDPLSHPSPTVAMQSLYTYPNLRKHLSRPLVSELWKNDHWTTSSILRLRPFIKIDDQEIRI